MVNFLSQSQCQTIASAKESGDILSLEDEYFRSDKYLSLNGNRDLYRSFAGVSLYFGWGDSIRVGENAFLFVGNGDAGKTSICKRLVLHENNLDLVGNDDAGIVQRDNQIYCFPTKESSFIDFLSEEIPMFPVKAIFYILDKREESTIEKPYPGSWVHGLGALSGFHPGDDQMFKGNAEAREEFLAVLEEPLRAIDSFLVPWSNSLNERSNHVKQIINEIILNIN